jgi:hypothetical protein
MFRVGRSGRVFPEDEDMMTLNLHPEFSMQKKLSLLHEISSTMVLTENVSTIANLMIDLATAHTLAEKGSIMLLNNSEELYIIASRGLDAELARTYRSTLKEGLVGKIASLKKPVFVDDVTRDDRFKECQSGNYRTRSFISCPIIFKDKLLGIININDRKDGQSFTDEDFTLVKILSNQAAAAIWNIYLTNQIKTKTLELEELNRKFINSDMAKAEFLNKISYELRSPLNSLKGALYCLKQDDTLLPKDRHEFMAILDSETDKMIEIVENKIDHLRLEDGLFLIKPSILDLREMSREILTSALLSESLLRRKIKVHLNLPANISHIAGDKVLVSQMFFHLLEGVTSPLKKNATIELTLAENDFIEINLKVSQTFPDQITSHLFNSRAFFQPGMSDAALKLTMARKIAENHGWTMTAKNTDQSFEIQVLIPLESRLKMDVALSSAMDLYLDFVSNILNVESCSIMLADEMTGDLTIRSAKGIEKNVIRKTRIRFGDRIAGWVAQEGKPLLIEDIEKDERFPQRVGNDYYNSRSLLSLPLKIANQTIGVLNLNNKKSARSFNQQDLRLTAMIGERISRMIETLRQNDQRDEDYRLLTDNLENLLNVGRIYQKKNQKLVDIVEKMSVHLDFDEELKDDAIYSSIIYDLGLMLVSEEVLQKKQRLSSSETNTIKGHPQTTVDLLNKIEFSQRVKNSILHHHENWDGSGYPNGLKGNQIPIISRVLAVADAYFSLIELRSHRPARSPQEAMDLIRQETGSKFDPTVVAALEVCLAC